MRVVWSCRGRTAAEPSPLRGGALAVALALAVATQLCAREAVAQSAPEMATRRVVLEQAEQARAAGNHAAALEAAQRAGAIHMTPSVRLFIAEEDLTLGHLSAAIGDADLCVTETERDTAAASRASIIARCREIELGARARSGQLIVHVPDPPPAGLRVTVAGESLASTLFGQPTFVAAGEIAVDAVAEGGAAFHTQVRVAAGDIATVNVALGRADHAAVQQASGAGAATPTIRDDVQRLPAPQHVGELQRSAPTTSTAGGSLSAARVVSLLGVGVGALALAVGIVLYVDVVGAYNRCVTTECAPSVQPRSENVAAVGLAWGGAALAVVAGAAFLLLPRSHERARAQLWIDPRGSAGITGVF